MQTLRTVNTIEREIKGLKISKVMKILFLGDSITAGAGLNTKEEMFTTLVGKLTNAQIVNYGVGGTRIARNSAPSEDPSYDNDFLRRAEDMDKTADFVFVFGGTNDYGHGDAPIGDVSDETPYTFCGAVNLLSRYLVNNYGKDNVCFILPLHRRNEDNPFGEGNKKIKSGTLSEYITAEIIVLEKNGVKYLDLRNDFPPEKLDKLTIDGIHPNAKGHKLIADRVCEYLNEVSLRLF